MLHTNATSLSQGHAPSLSLMYYARRSGNRDQEPYQGERQRERERERERETDKLSAFAATIRDNVHSQSIHGTVFGRAPGACIRQLRQNSNYNKGCR